nr:hypothetical protein Iba_chr14dCG15920 [Ipomoea batatas]
MFASKFYFVRIIHASLAQLREMHCGGGGYRSVCRDKALMLFIFFPLMLLACVRACWAQGD